MTEAAERERILSLVRELCLALPETSERESHGSPTFFVRGSTSFLSIHDDDDGLAIWCAAPAEMQTALVEADPDRFFVPPYVGRRGWLGLRLDLGVDEEELAGIVEDAYAEVAPQRLVDEAHARKERR